MYSNFIIMSMNSFERFNKVYTIWIINQIFYDVFTQDKTKLTRRFLCIALDIADFFSLQVLLQYITIVNKLEIWNFKLK